MKYVTFPSSYSHHLLSLYSMVEQERNFLILNQAICVWHSALPRVQHIWVILILYNESESHSVSLCDSTDYTVHGILQVRILEWVPFPSPEDLPNPEIKSRYPTLQVDSLPAEPPRDTKLNWKLLSVLKHWKGLR